MFLFDLVFFIVGNGNVKGRRQGRFLLLGLLPLQIFIAVPYGNRGKDILEQCLKKLELSGDQVRLVWVGLG